MTGDAPQPGRTPNDQAEPWALADPDTAWWRKESDPEPPGSPEAEARAAAARDLIEGSRLATAGELMIIEPSGRDGAPAVPEGVEDQEITDRNRPTVVLHTHRPLPDVEVSPEVEARLERMENSPFWLSEAERAAAEATRPLPPMPGRRRRLPSRGPGAPLAGLVALSLVAAFFGWVSAEPFWLAAGHGDSGQATTTSCRGNALSQHCVGDFRTDDGRFSVSHVTLLGLSGEGREPGAVTPARMVGPGSSHAYAGPAGPVMHLRWMLGFLLVLICGYAIAQTTGANRLESPMKRRRALVLSIGAPLLLLLGFLVAAF